MNSSIQFKKITIGGQYLWQQILAITISQIVRLSNYHRYGENIIVDTVNRSLTVY